MNLKITLMLAVILTAWLVGGCVSKEVSWIGHPVISDNHSSIPTKGWLPDYVIGFRGDGQVVWKEIKKDD